LKRKTLALILSLSAIALMAIAVFAFIFADNSIIPVLVPALAFVASFMSTIAFIMTRKDKSA